METKPDDVIKLDSSVPSIELDKMSTVKEFSEAICRGFHLAKCAHFNRMLREFGLDVSFLPSETGGWQKGKLHLRLEFIPDEEVQE